MSSNLEFDNISFDLPKNQSNVIKVIGVGGGGSNGKIRFPEKNKRTFTATNGTKITKESGQAGYLKNLYVNFDFAKENSIIILFIGEEIFPFIKQILFRNKLLLFAKSQNLVLLAKGMITINLPFLSSSAFDFSIKYLIGSVWVFLARFLSESSDLVEPLKNGGLLIIKSNFELELKDCNEEWIIEILLLQLDFLQFSVACLKAFNSSSIPVISDDGFLWAAIKQINPVPHPISSIFLEFSKSDHDPSKTPSVPIFIADLSCATSNCST